MTEPVTESLVVHWQPTAHYHLHRLDLLAEAKSEGMLQEFIVTPETVGVRTEASQVRMSEGELFVHPRGPLLQEEVLDLLRRALRCASPPSYHFQLAYQFLVPIAGQSYDDARLAALDRLSLGAFRASDFALMIEGTELGARWGCEFGLLSEEEVEPRLRRWVGGSRERSGAMPTFVDLPADIAPVSFFADVGWLVPDRQTRGDDSTDDIAETIRELRERTEWLVSGLSAQVGEGSLQPVAEGSTT